jgi:hypothetical protein
MSRAGVDEEAVTTSIENALSRAADGTELEAIPVNTIISAGRPIRADLDTTGAVAAASCAVLVALRAVCARAAAVCARDAAAARCQSVRFADVGVSR